MNYIAFINSIQIHLPSDVSISMTKQLNDIADVNTRETNFTKQFQIKKIRQNILAVELLSILGNQSTFPYKKNTFQLIDADSGLHLIHDGWCTITDNDIDTFNIHSYDGLISLYKLIENKNISDSNIADLTHEKTVQNVVDSWNNNMPYKYILADYNGKAMIGTNGKINSDYLVPSVKILFLWQKIQEYCGYTFLGNIFSNNDFTKLYLTYPKATPTNNIEILCYDGNLTNAANVHEVNLTQGTIINRFVFDGINLKCTYKANYTIKLQFGYSFYRLFLNENLIVNYDPNNALPSIYLNLEVNDIISFTCGSITQTSQQSNANLKIIENSLGIIDFVNELSGLSIKNLISEIVWKFGLTMFIDNFEKTVNFKTLAEITNIDNAIDWSDRYCQKLNEKYIYEDYAQKNIFSHKYNDQDVSYNDSEIYIDNKNISDFKTVVNSQIYTPEKNKSSELGFPTNVYKLWNKEIGNDNQVKYKDLQDRFYFITENEILKNGILKSGVIGTELSFTTCPVESYDGLPFTSTVPKYYTELSKLLNQSKLVTLELWLSVQDFVNADFSVPYYFEQESEYFLLNKIISFQKDKKTKCEFIRLNY